MSEQTILKQSPFYALSRLLYALAIGTAVIGLGLVVLL